MLALEFFFSRDKYDSEGEDNYKPCGKYDNFDDFVSNIICCHEGCYMKQDTISELHPDGMAEISFKEGLFIDNKLDGNGSMRIEDANTGEQLFNYAGKFESDVPQY